MAVTKGRKKSKHELRNQSLDLLNDVAEQIENEDGGSYDGMKRRLRALALRKIEKSARIREDFEKIINIWDLDDKSRRRKDERYLSGSPLYRIETDSDTGDIEDIDEVICTDTVFPIPFRFELRTRYWRQVISGDFLDCIHDCKADLHEMTSRKDLSEALESLTDNQKEIFYSIVIEGKSPQEIAKERGQTDRNIRKVYAGALSSIRKKLNNE